jgi:hypothetical protein
MAAKSKQIKDFMSEYKVADDEVWEVHGSAWVVKHKALERVAAEMGIVFDEPKFIEHDALNKVAVLCVSGMLKDRHEWSVGEASPANNKNAYPYAMAEKRAKDRVILKLLNTHGALYSEAEADDFAERVQPAKRQNPHVTRPDDISDAVIEYDAHGQPIDNIPIVDGERMKRVADMRPVFETLQKSLHSAGSIADLKKWGSDNAAVVASLKADWQEILRKLYAEHQAELRKQASGDELRMAG